MENWYKLVYDHCITKRRYGLSIPYLVGALKLKNDNIDTIERLIKSIAGTEENHDFVVRYCHTIHAHVIGIENPIYSQLQRAGISNYGKLFADEDLDELNNIEEVISKLEENYSSQILEGKFSRIGYPPEWSKFTNEDIDNIDAVLG